MRGLFLAVSALTVSALAACGRHEAPVDSSPLSAASPQPSADTPVPPHRAVTQASAVLGDDGDRGGYDMPRAPIPYNALGAYERQMAQQDRQAPPSSVQPGQSGQPGRPLAPPRRRTTQPRPADTVFY